MLILKFILFYLCLDSLPSHGLATGERVRRSHYLNMYRQAKKVIQKRIIYTYGLTLAEISRNPFDRSLQYCKLTELKNGEDCTKTLSSTRKPVKMICWKKMMALIEECRTMRTGPDNLEDEVNVGDDTGFIDGLFSGIFPGTKWCGSGSRAKNYFDLGSEAELDKCCRAHDHCPLKVLPMTTGFGDTNYLVYTKSHCDCDVDFFNCLMGVKRPRADTVGEFYFNNLKIPCIRESPEENMCPSPTNRSDHCSTAFLQDKIKLNTFETEFVYPERKLPKEESDENSTFW